VLIGVLNDSAAARRQIRQKRLMMMGKPEAAGPAFGKHSCTIAIQPPA
jgi:hypothetical protein